MKLKVGDTVKWRGGFGGDYPKDAKIEQIEIDCKNKSGTEVDEIPWNKVDTREVIVVLDNGHWAYGTQLSRKDLGYCMECNGPATRDCEHH